MSSITLRIRYADGRTEERSLQSGASYRIGRDEGDICLQDPNVSAVHAQLHVSDGGASIADLGSTNGTFDPVGQRLSAEPHVLAPGASVRLGDCSLTLVGGVGAGRTRVMPQMPPPAVSVPPPAVSVPPPSANPAPPTTSPPTHAQGQPVPQLAEPRAGVSSNNKTLIAALLVAVAAAGTASFVFDGDRLSKSSLETLIDRDMLDSNASICWSLKDMDRAEFPIQIAVTSDPILKGLQKGGFIQLGRAFRAGVFSPFYESLDLTEKGREAKVWDPEKGFCVGRRGVREILNWTEPAANSAGITTSQVSYTYEIVERPDWVDPDKFATIPGMTKPIEGTYRIKKTNEGWRAF